MPVRHGVKEVMDNDEAHGASAKVRKAPRAEHDELEGDIDDLQEKNANLKEALEKDLTKFSSGKKIFSRQHNGQRA